MKVSSARGSTADAPRAWRIAAPFRPMTLLPLLLTALGIPAGPSGRRLTLTTTAADQSRSSQCTNTYLRGELRGVAELDGGDGCEDIMFCEGYGPAIVLNISSTIADRDTVSVAVGYDGARHNTVYFFLYRQYTAWHPPPKMLAITTGMRYLHGPEMRAVAVRLYSRSKRTRVRVSYDCRPRELSAAVLERQHDYSMARASLLSALVLFSLVFISAGRHRSMMRAVHLVHLRRHLYERLVEERVTLNTLANLPLITYRRLRHGPSSSYVRSDEGSSSGAAAAAGGGAANDGGEAPQPSAAEASTASGTAGSSPGAAASISAQPQGTGSGGPSAPIVADGGGQETDRDRECAICYEVFAADEKVRLLPCGHYFHSECLQSWFDTRSFETRPCPLCKADAAIPKEAYEA